MAKRGTVGGVGLSGRVVLCGVVALASVLTAGLVGCAEGDPVADAVRTARLELVSGGGQRGAEADAGSLAARMEAYGRVIATLEGALRESGGSPSADAARLVIAEAEAGRAAIAARELEGVRGDLLDRVAVGRALVEGLGIVEQSAREIAAFDADRERARLRGEEAAAERMVAGAARELVSAEEALAEARGRVEAAEGEAREARLRENAARERALRLRGMARAEALEEAVGHEREAQAHERRASELQLGVRAAEREVRDAARGVRAAERQLEVVRDLIAAVGEAERTTAEYAELTAGLRASYEERLDAVVGEVGSVYGGAFSDAYGSVLERYEAAERSARSVGGAVGELASDLRGWSLQSRAGVVLSRASLARGAAELMSRAGRSSEARALREEAAGLEAEAAGLLEEAAGAMRGGGESSRRARELMEARAAGLRGEGSAEEVGEGAGGG